MPLVEDVTGLMPGDLVELYVIDTTVIGLTEVLRFHAGVNLVRQPVVWQGVTYEPLPIQVTGFEEGVDSTLPAPTLAIANVDNMIGSLCDEYDDLIGAKVIRKRTMVKYLDAVNFPGGVNPSADPNQRFADDVFVLDRRTREDDAVVQFELRAPFDCPNFKGGRPMVAHYCGWQYRGEGCGYAGGPVAKADNTPTSDPALDDCSKTRIGCKLRNWPDNILPTGSFPGTSLL